MFIFPRAVPIKPLAGFPKRELCSSVLADVTFCVGLAVVNALRTGCSFREKKTDLLEWTLFGVESLKPSP